MIAFRAIEILRVAATVGHVIALNTTIYRVFYQIRSSRFSWADIWAFLAFSADASCLVCLWLNAYLNDHHESMGTQIYRNRRMAVYWLMSTSFSGAIWLSRISLVCTLVRLSGVVVKKVSILSTVLFMLWWFAVFVWKISTCLRETSWLSIPFAFCQAGRAEGILEIIMDAASCICLILLTAHVLRRMNLPSKERKLIILLFSGSIFTAMGCLAHSLYILSKEDILETFTGHFEAAISLTVCNVLVVMTSIYNLLYRNREPEAKSTSKTRGPSPPKSSSSFQPDMEMNQMDSSTSAGANTILTFTEVSSLDSVNSRVAGMRVVPDDSQSLHDSSQEFIYYTESEACSGSAIVVLDPSDSESTNQRSV